MAKKKPKKIVRDRRTRTRDTDMLTTSDKVKQGSAATAAFIGMTAFIYQMSEMLKNYTSWDRIQTPVGVGEILATMFFAFTAFGGAYFTDFGKLLALIRGRPQ